MHKKQHAWFQTLLLWARVTHRSIRPRFISNCLGHRPLVKLIWLKGNAEVTGRTRCWGFLLLLGHRSMPKMCRICHNPVPLYIYMYVCFVCVLYVCVIYVCVWQGDLMYMVLFIVNTIQSTLQVSLRSGVWLPAVQSPRHFSFYAPNYCTRMHVQFKAKNFLFALKCIRVHHHKRPGRVAG